MSSSPLVREALHLRRDRAFLGWLALTLLLSSLSIVSGLEEVRDQNQTIDRLILSDREDRQQAQALHPDWGSLAYYSFHLTYDRPSDFAFAALGVRDAEPWKHRVRMLALEGQIYERDAGNPELALIGRFDFAFFASFVLPLILIVTLHDVQASERSAGRHALLVSTSGNSAAPWRIRALLRAGLIFVAGAIPLAAGAVVSNALGVLVAAIVGLGIYVAVWSFGTYLLAAWEKSSAVILATLLGVWVVVGIVGPAVEKLIIDGMVPVPDGADILLTQREAVNDAWDLPESVTMDAFVERYPEWKDHTGVGDDFEWKWYYAFQQVGDQQTEALSKAYRAGRERRDQWAGLLSVLTPPVFFERFLQKLAATDFSAHLAYEHRVRQFHATLRSYYYPKLFLHAEFDSAALEELPDFSESSRG